MKRLFPALALLTLLSACGGGGNDSAACNRYWFGTTGACIPETWIVIEKDDLLDRGAPGDVVVAFQAKEPVAGQFPTITITEERLPSEVTAKEYSDASVRAVAALPGYELIDTRSVTIDEESVALHVFFSKPLTEEPQRRFFQAATVSEGVGFAVTAMTPSTIKSALEDQIETIMTSITFRAPVEEQEAN